MRLRGRGSSLSIDVGTVSLGRLAAFAISLAIPIVLTWVLSVEEYGVYKELSLLVLTLQPILMFGIPSSLKYFIPRSSDMDKRRYMTQTLVFSLVIGIGLFILLTVFGGFLSEIFFKENLGEYMLVLGAHGFLLLTSAYIGVVMIVNDDVNLAGFTAIAFSILDVIFMCGAVIVFESVMALLIAIAAASAIKFAVSVQYIISAYRPAVSLITRSSLRTHLSFSIPMGISDIVNILHINVDKFFIAFFFSTETFGIYSVGALITPMILVIYRSVVDITVPQFSKLYKERRMEDFIRLWHESLRKLALLFYPLFIFLIIFAGELLAVFPAAYADAQNVFRLYIVLLPLNVTFFTGVLIAMGRSRVLLKATFYTLVMNVILNYLLIKWFIVLGWGILGPPVATIIANVFLRWLMLMYIIQFTMRPASSLFPAKLLARIMAVAILSGLATVGCMLLSGFTLFDGLLAMPDAYPGIAHLLDNINLQAAKLITGAAGFAIFSAFYFIICRKLSFIIPADIDMVKTFLRLKR